MTRIVPLILTLLHHIALLAENPEHYRPEACPHCGMARPVAHGSYPRKPDRPTSEGDSLNPILIPRFLCRHCGRTCSRLPSCVAPRRWYLWRVQQAVLALLLAGVPIGSINPSLGPARQTMKRWWNWLQEKGQSMAFHLRSLFPELGRYQEGADFWQACFDRLGLAEAMAALDGLGEVVP